jgi:hypothetical protein
MRRRPILFVLIILATLPVWSQSHSDPLSDDEAEQVREYADRPPERIKLFMKFIDQRVTGIRQIAKEPDRANKLHNLLEEFTRLVDELQDNLDVYSGTHDDLRKPLKSLVDESSKWPEVLNLPAPDRVYDFSRKTALEAASSANDEAKKMLAEQEQYFLELKKKGKDAQKEKSSGPS